MKTITSNPDEWFEQNMNETVTRFEIYNKTEENKKYYNSIIDKISDIRKKNNENWMSILRLCFSSNPKEAKKIFKNITDNDKQINKLSRELCK